MATNDASGQGLQSAVNIWRQTIFVEKITGIWSPKHNRQFPYEILSKVYDYSIEKITQNYWSLVRSESTETGFVILSKFWTRNDLRYHRNRIVFCYDRGYLSKRTVLNLVLFKCILEYLGTRLTVCTVYRSTRTADAALADPVVAGTRVYTWISRILQL
jgi:hypothetical protein